MDIHQKTGRHSPLKSGLQNVLNYTAQLMASRAKVFMDVDKDSVASFHEGALAGLEGMRFNVAPEIWLTFDRIKETRPPEPDAVFQGWYDFGQHPSAVEAPALKSELLVRVNCETASDLFEAEILTQSTDVLEADRNSVDMALPIIVTLQTKNMPDFVAQWREYVDGPWAAWSLVERPRRKSIEVYNALYQINQRMTSFGMDTPIEMVLGLGMARWLCVPDRINTPLIEQPVELEMDESGQIAVRPRQFLPQIKLAAFHHVGVEGSESVQKDVTKQLNRTATDPDVGFSPFDRSTFESALRTCTTRLAKDGLYHPDETHEGDREIPRLSEVLLVTDTWVLFARARTNDPTVDDVKRLIEKVEAIELEELLPKVGLSFVKSPSDVLFENYDDGGINIGSGNILMPEAPRTAAHGTPNNNSSGGTGRARGDTLFFPLPFNLEQEAVIRRLEDPETFGCNVQGPPGTGKTHTIANIVCHYMATGRRVLVTAKTPEALTALQEKIPEGIRDLAISVIHNDREGANQLEKAVRILADTVKGINPRQVADEILDSQARLMAIRDELDGIDAKLQDFANSNLSSISFRGAQLSPMDLAKVVSNEREEYAWFLDLISQKDLITPTFGPTELDEIRDLRSQLGPDAIYATDDLLELSELPPLASVMAAHSDLTRLHEIEQLEASGGLLLIALDQETTIDHAQDTLAWLNTLKVFFDQTKSEAWALDVYHVIIGVKQVDELLRERLAEEVSTWARLHSVGAAFVLKDIKCPLEDNQALDTAISDYCVGKSPGGVFSLFKGALKAALGRIELEGRQPVTAEDWKIIREFRSWQKDLSSFCARWSGFARIAGLPIFSADPVEGHAAFLSMGRLIRAAHQLKMTQGEKRSMLKRIFPYGVDVDATVFHGKYEGAIEALTANVERANLFEAKAVESKIRSYADDINKQISDRGKSLSPSESNVSNSPLCDALNEIIEEIGSKEAADNRIANKWQFIRTEVGRLEELKPRLKRLDVLTAQVRECGGFPCADFMRYRQPGNDDDFIPSNFIKAWDWAQAEYFLKELGRQDIVRSLTDQRSVLEIEQRKLLGDIIKLRTHLGLKKSITPKIDVALAKFTTAIARLGKGTGKDATRQQRLIREAAQDASLGVPCWILPEWRVAEQLPSELGIFDLVVVDEASQSDITAFPIILRGKKVLIVGDDQQVSPTVIGLQLAKVAQLRATFLAGLPFANQMDPATSLYELGGMVFPGKSTMLREHFRCVEPIISFSSRFYPRPLLPLRIPKTSERLDPPLIDIFIKHGERHGEINLAEVNVIVAEITKLAHDAKYAKLSFGVISLIGEAQAQAINNRLISDLGTEEMLKHKIMCGNASTFQGQERDIMFLSMVACPKTARSESARNVQQRFNVAASRARDRMVLVRSVRASDLKPGDIKLDLIEHFRNPMAGGNIAPPSDILELCGSGFERDFGRRLLDLGYRLRPQVSVAGYFIDFVIEGEGDRRLAIELDGDYYHGPDRWAADINRQKMLERLDGHFGAAGDHLGMRIRRRA